MTLFLKEVTCSLMKDIFELHKSSNKNGNPLVYSIDNTTLSNDDTCPLCHSEPETILHRLRDCGTSKQIWERLGVRQNSNFYEGNLGHWLEYNSKSNTHRLREQPLGESSFLLPFGCCGSIEMLLFLGTCILKQMSIRMRLSDPWSFSIVG